MTKVQLSNEAISSIVSAFASRPDTNADDIVALVVRLKREFGAEGDARADAPLAAAAPARAEPALPVSQAVTQNTVYCLCCGKGFKMLKRHLRAEHGLTEQEYRRLYSLPDDMPLVAPSYSDQKAKYAKKAKLGKYSRKGGGKAGKQKETIS